MLPAYFGDSERALFGLCVPAAGERQRRSALICAPLLDEYFWAHRTCRMLGDRLAKQGIDVLRFDYYGSGDSGGESNDTRLDGAVSDTLIALQELRDFSQNRRTTLIGMRLGAVVAARATLRSNNVDRLVLWDPVCDGREWVADLEARANVAGDQRMDLNGLPVSAELRREAAAIDLDAFATSASEVLLIVSHVKREHHQLRETLEGRGVRVSFSAMENPPFWSEQGDLGLGAVPADIVEHVAGWAQ